MKRKLSILISLIAVLAVVLTGCGGGGGGTTTVNDQEAIAESQSTLDTFYSSIENSDTEKLKTIIPDDGVTISGNETQESGTYSAEKIVNELSTQEGSYLGLLNEMNQTTEVNGDTVTIRGESYSGLYLSDVYSLSNNTDKTFSLYSSMGNALSKNLNFDKLTSTENSIKSLNNYSGNNLSITYPDAWESASTDTTDGEALIALSPKFELLLSFWIPNVFESETLDTVTNGIINELEGNSRIEFTTEPVLENFELDNSSGKKMSIEYNQEYTPLIIEYKLTNQNGKYYLTNISIYMADSTSTVAAKEKAYIINNNNDLYFASYGSIINNFDLEEANKILDSLTIK
jgi:hypothetical protein